MTLHSSSNAIAAPYEALAAEYYDPQAHPTCHNLNRLSRHFIERWLPEGAGGLDILEVGAGESAVAPLLLAAGQPLGRLALHDQSPAMLAHSARWQSLGARAVVSDACALQRPDADVDLLVSSLGDPYNLPAFWAEAARVCRPGAVLLYTMPSFAWAARFRRQGSDSGLDVAEFVLRDGRRLGVPSHVWPLHEQVRLIEAAGWMVLQLESLGAEALPAGDRLSPKAQVFGPGATSSLVWGFRAVRQPPAAA